MEYVTEEDALGAIGELLNFVDEGKVRHVGISSYRIELFSPLARAARERYGRPLDTVQNWGQTNLQNGRLESDGLKALKAAGVMCVLNASPLYIGFLRAEGVPVGKMGDFHPAPEGLRQACRDVAGYVKDQKENLAAVALRYALWRAEVNSNEPFRLCTITGISTISDLTENVGTAHKLLKPAEATPTSLASATRNNGQVDKDRPVFEKAQKMFGQWMGYSFTSPDRRWSTELKHMLQESEL